MGFTHLVLSPQEEDAQPACRRRRWTPQALQANEQYNLELAADAVCCLSHSISVVFRPRAIYISTSGTHNTSQMYRLGGIPPIPPSVFASAEEGRVLIPYVSHLCARLLHLGKEADSAAKIQNWCACVPFRMSSHR